MEMGVGVGVAVGTGGLGEVEEVVELDRRLDTDTLNGLAGAGAVPAQGRRRESTRKARRRACGQGGLMDAQRSPMVVVVVVMVMVLCGR